VHGGAAVDGAVGEAMDDFYGRVIITTPRTKACPRGPRVIPPAKEGDSAGFGA